MEHGVRSVAVFVKGPGAGARARSARFSKRASRSR
jgi:ribosomal protein S11